MNSPFRSLRHLLAGLALALTAFSPLAFGQDTPPPPSLTVRSPMLISEVTANRTHIVFSFAGDLWRVERSGGEAQRLTELPGEEDAPSFSPDGAWLAFSRDSGGGGDIWLMPAEGGEPRRLTWHPKVDRVRGWTPDGKRILFATNRDGDGVWRLYTLAVDGVLPEALPFPEGRTGAFSPDGTRIALVPFGTSWIDRRHYRGGGTNPIWIARLADSKVEARPALAGPDANNRYPVWIGDVLYFVSDRTGTPNLFSRDLRSGKTEQLTRYPKHGILWAAPAPDGVVFVADGAIHLWEAAGKQDRTVELRLTLPAPERAARTVPALKFLDQAVPAPGGGLLVTARGEVLSYDPQSKQARNLTRTPGVAERSAVPSPDGKWIACFSDASGEYQLHVMSAAMPAAGEGQVRRISIEDHPSFYRELTWSPDGRRIAFSDKRLSLWVADLGTGKAQKIATSSHIGQGVWIPSWSPDGRWLAFSRALQNRVRTIFLWDSRDGRVHQVTDGKVQADLPAFDRSGHYLYFTLSTSARTASADDLTWGVMSSILARPLVSASIHALVLRKGDFPPFLAGKPHPKARFEPAAGPVEIDLDEIDRRIVPVSSDARDFVGLAAGPPGVLFAQVQEWPTAPIEGDTSYILYRYNLTKGAEPEKLTADVEDFAVSADGSTLLVRSDGRDGPSLTLVPAVAPADAERKPLDLASLTVEVDPPAEWRQMYREAWRLARDWFYDPGHHGQNLGDLEAHFAAYLPGVARRTDLNALFDWMFSYLSISHLTVDGGDEPPPAGKPERIGLLGADFTLDQGRWRVARIYRSGHPSNANPLLRAPLDQPGVDVREGDYLLSVDGEEIRADRDVYSYFVGKAGKPAELKVSANPGGSEARASTVAPLSGENTLRRMDWAEANRRRVEEQSGGRLAYVYLPNHGGPGYEEFLRGLLGSLNAEGVIIDQRWSPGGVVFDSAIELLQRKPLYAYAWREGDDLPLPTNYVAGAKTLIINRQNGSAAETLALMWKLAGLGPIVGTRTSGGGIGGALFRPELIDGGRITIPGRASYDPHGTWGIENDGVRPDVPVEWDAESWRAGRDPQLEAAIQAVMKEIPKVKPWQPKKPAYPKYP